MELRRVDPRILKANAHNPRKIQPGELSDAALAASIKTVGILQPPAATEKNGELTIAYGARRVEPTRPAMPARQGHPRSRPRRSRRLDLHPPCSAVRPLPSRNRSPLGSPARLSLGLSRHRRRIGRDCRGSGWSLWRAERFPRARARRRSQQPELGRKRASRRRTSADRPGAHSRSAPPRGGGGVAGQFIAIVRNAGAAIQRPRSHGVFAYERHRSYRLGRRQASFRLQALRRQHA